MLPDRELRIVQAAPELRAAADGEPRLGFKGLAAAYNRRTLIGDRPWGFVEVIKPGAFDGVLADDVRLLRDHLPTMVLARTASGTLRLSTDDDGLLVDADMADVSYARDLAVLLERRDVNQMSFAFRVAGDGDEWTVIDDPEDEFNNMELRTITRFAKLYDVSAVTFPAYEDTTAGLREATEQVLAEARSRLRGPGAERGNVASIPAGAWAATQERALRHLAHKESK